MRTRDEKGVITANELLGILAVVLLFLLLLAVLEII